MSEMEYEFEVMAKNDEKIFKTYKQWGY